MQLFSADATIFFKKLNKKKICPPQNIEKLQSKVAHNTTRPPVFSPALCGTQLSILRANVEIKKNCAAFGTEKYFQSC